MNLLFDDIEQIARTTTWEQDEPSDADLFNKMGGMIYNLRFWLRSGCGVVCDFIYYPVEPGYWPWRGESVCEYTALEAFHKSLEVNKYLLG